MKHPFLILTEDNLSDIWQLRQRAKRDSERHRHRIKEAVKQNLHDLIAREDIISQDASGKKIKVPVKYLDQWHFKYGKNKHSQGTGHSDQGLKPGDIIVDESVGRRRRASDQSGEMVFEEFELEEVIEMMLEDLNLPWFEEKPEKSEIETAATVYEDINKKGIIPNIDIRRTLKENLKRNASIGKAVVGGFKQDDLRFKTYNIKKEYRSNAAVILIMDRSGSMTTEKKYIAKSFFFWLVQFIKRKYSKTEIVFIGHDTEAHLCTEREFFSISPGGGTKCSSGFEMALDQINELYSPERWNNYVFAMSDGDNLGDDNKVCSELVNELLPLVNAIGYGEITADDNFYRGGTNEDSIFSTLRTEFLDSVISDKFMSVAIAKREDIYDCLKQFFGLKHEH